MKNGTLNRLVHISEIGCVNITPFNLNINGNIKNHRDKTNGISYTMDYYDDNSPKYYADNRGTIIEYNIDGTIAKMVKSKK